MEIQWRRCCNVCMNMTFGCAINKADRLENYAGRSLLLRDTAFKHFSDLTHVLFGYLDIMGDLLDGELHGCKGTGG